MSVPFASMFLPTGPPNLMWRISYQNRMQLPSTSFTEHVSIHQKCGACGLKIEEGETIVALYRDNDRIAMMYASFYQATGICQPAYAEGTICYQAACLEKPELQESATIHTDCLKLFARECNVGHKLEKLFFAATAIYPWRASAALALPRHLSFRAIDVQYVSDACGLPGLNTLPSELKEMIWRESPPHLLWRYCHVIQLARDLAAAGDEDFVVLRMAEVHEWRRGGAPVMQDVEDKESFMRITIDSQGISVIERVTQAAMAAQARNPQDRTKRYIARPIRDMVMIKAKFQYGFCRLLVASTADIEIWDTPTPPKLLEDNITPYELPTHARLITVPTNPTEASGLTFMFTNRLLFGIHVHTKATPSARNVRGKFEYSGNLTWVYVPLTPGDEIISLGIRIPRSHAGITEHAERFAYLVLTKRKSGEILLGVNYARAAHEIFIQTEPNPKLFYDDTINDKMVLGAYPRLPVEPVRREVPLPRSPLRESFFSQASLDNVYKTQVFSDRQTQKCMGILFEYRDGSQKTIGQCRLGVDLVETCIEPTRICYYATQFLRFPEMQHEASQHFADLRMDMRSILPHCPGYKIKCTSGGEEHAHGELGSWTCFAMTGSVMFWFIGEISKMQINGHQYNGSMST